MEDKQLKATIYLFGNSPASQIISDRFKEEANIIPMPYSLDEISSSQQALPHIIFCSPPPQGISLLEVAQTLRMQHMDVPIFFVGQATDGYDKPTLIKNGFTDVFLLPLDDEVMKTSIEEQIVLARKSGKFYRPVRLVDIEPGNALEFDTYLFMPMNKKYVFCTRSGEAITDDRAQKLKKHKVGSIHVSHDQVHKFYQYTAARFQNLATDNKISETERRDRLKTAVRELFSGMFSSEASSIQSGIQTVDDFRKIVAAYISNTSSGQWYKRILSATADTTDTYSHAANTSTFATLFSLALGIGNPEDMALAGLLHDIGMANVPIEIQKKPKEQWTPEEKKEYEKHPEHTVNLIKNKKLVVSGLVHRMILQHHERTNGSGYPKGLVGSKICAEAQILAIADRFDELTAVTLGKARMSPTEAIEYLRNQSNLNLAQAEFEPEILKKIISLFPSDESSSSTQTAA